MASSIQATRLRKGMLIKVGNNLFRILELHHLTPGNKRAHIQVRMRNIRTLMLADEKFRAEEDIERATLDEREMQYLYNDGDHYYFMDTSSFEQIHISAEALGDSKNYLVPDAIIRVEFYEVEPVGIELPPTVDLVVKETVPGIKGATASAQVKPATLETGLVVQVPSVRQRGRQGPRQHRDGRVPVARLNVPRGSVARGRHHEAILVFLGFGFLVANTRLAIQYLQYRKRVRGGALLTWLGPKPPYYAMALAIGVALGLLVMVKLYRGRADLRRVDDVHLLCLSVSAEPEHQARLLRGRHLGRHRVHPVQRGRRRELARGRAQRDAGHHFAAAQPGASSERAGRQVRGGAAPAPRQDRRSRDSFLRHASTWAITTSAARS